MIKPKKACKPKKNRLHLKNLIPLNKRSPEDLKRITSMGGKANKNNEKSRVGQKIRWLKEKGLTDDNAKKFYEIMSDHNVSSMDIRLYIEKIKKDASNTTQQINLANTLINWYKMTFGDRIKTENVNINIDLDMDPGEVERLTNFMKGED